MLWGQGSHLTWENHYYGSEFKRRDIYTHFNSKRLVKSSGPNFLSLEESRLLKYTLLQRIYFHRQVKHAKQKKH
jgi:hypothetical protein